MKRFPESWVICDFGQVVENADGARKPVSLAKREEIKGTYPYYGATGQIDSLNNYTHDGEYILIGEDGANLLSKSKKLAFVASGKFWVNNHAHAVKALAGMPSQFIEKFINSLDLMPFITGSAQPKLTKSNLEKIPFPLASLAEQKVIAEKLDSLLAQVESTKTRLESIPGILKQFRQSVLAAAVSGELTEDLCEFFLTVNLSDVALFQNGFAFKSEWFKNEGEYQVIKLGNIRDANLEINNSPAFISKIDAKSYLKFKPDIGDSLISMTGTRFKRDYGFACLVKEDLDILVNQRVGRIIPDAEKTFPGYLNMILRSDKFREDFFKGETGGVNQGNVGSKHIMSIEIAIPTLESQKEIVRRVEELFGFSDKVAAQVKTAMESVNHLTQSILAQAFSGELTKDWREQNPDLISGENSAAALLERIKAEREKLKAGKKG